MHKSIDFSKTKLISNPIKEITWDTNFDDSVRNIIIPSDENRIEFFSLQNAKTMDLEQLIELQKTFGK